MSLGELYLRRGHLCMAEQYFEDLVELCPDMILPYCQLGYIYIQINKNKAIEILEKARSVAEGKQDKEVEYKIKQVLHSIRQ